MGGRGLKPEHATPHTNAPCTLHHPSRCVGSVEQRTPGAVLPPPSPSPSPRVGERCVTAEHPGAAPHLEGLELCWEGWSTEHPTRRLPPPPPPPLLCVGSVQTVAADHPIFRGRAPREPRVLKRAAYLAAVSVLINSFINYNCELINSLIDRGRAPTQVPRQLDSAFKKRAGQAVEAD